MFFVFGKSKNRQATVADLEQRFSELTTDKTAIQQYIANTKELLKDRSYSNYKYFLYASLAAAYHKLGDRNHALSYINQSLSLNKSDEIKALKGLIQGKGSNAIDTYNSIRDLVCYHAIEKETFFFQKSAYDNAFQIMKNDYTSNFLSIPIQKRRFLTLTNQIDYAQNRYHLPYSFLLLTPDELPQGIELHGDIPLTETLYVVHPYKPTHYIPINQYEDVLFEDEKNEFIHIMDVMGAKHIAYKNVHDLNTHIEKTQERNTEGGVNVADTYKVNADYTSNREGSSQQTYNDEKINDSNFELNPNMLPQVPTDVVWYPHREEWQRKCQSRLEGRWLKDTFQLSTNSSESISDTQKKNLEVEMSSLIKVVQVSANGSHKKEDTYNICTSKSHTWQCEVEFYPMSEYNKSAKVVGALPANSNGKSKYTKWIIIGVAIVAAVVTTLLIVL